MYNIVNKFIREAKDYYLDKDLNKVKDKSAGEFCYEKYCELIKNKFDPNDQSKETKFLKSLIAGFLVWRCKSENIEIGCHTVTEISMKNYCVFKDCAGSQIMEPKYGYKNIIDFMIEPYKHEFIKQVKLRHALKRILLCSSQSNCSHCKYTDNSNKVVLIVNDVVNNCDLIVICDHVVCTMSLGFLKENIKKLIEPIRLVPSEKLLAIERIGYGTVNKIFLIYDKPFWELNVTSFHPIWFLKENETIISKLDEINESNWFENIPYFDIVKNHENILCAWLSGCEFVENFTDEKIARDCTILIRKFFRDESIPEPKKVIK